jgi:tetratricopeptide (TPR) repeat protein
MKKAFLLASILFISVISTACINNFAVQELNNKAKAFMDSGDYASAIERLKSSVDLDGSIFETQYNLAVAYTKAEDYPNAIKTYNDAIKLNPDFADAYYSLAVCEENLAKDILSGEVTVNEDGTVEKVEDVDTTQDKTLSEPAENLLNSTLTDAINDYKLYLDKSDDDKTSIEAKIKELEELLEKHTK